MASTVLITKMRMSVFPFWLVVLSLACPAVSQTISPVPSPSPQTAFPTPSAPAAPPVKTEPAAEPTKPCYHCNGAGIAKCRVCVNGQMDCPAPCLKLSTPGWQHMEVAGHGPDELWMKYPHDDGSGWQAWSQAHIGQIVKRKDGRATVVETCPTCKGKTRVPCTVCQGKVETTCTMCAGSKTVPQSWTAFNNPRMKNRPSHFKLKDGSEVVGRKVIGSETSIIVKTEKGNVEINLADLVSEEKPAKETPFDTPQKSTGP